MKGHLEFLNRSSEAPPFQHSPTQTKQTKSSSYENHQSSV